MYFVRPFFVLLLLLCIALPQSSLAANTLEPVPLGALTAQLYSYALRIAGLGVFIMFIIAGLAYMLPPVQKYVGNPVTIIQDAIIGLIILVSAFVILNSINKDLVTGGSTPTTQSGN